MDHMKTFLDTSTIHGLSWISGSKQFIRFFWIFVVLGGFSGAVYLIHESFYNWKESPISTTVETLPITKLSMPNITVCPPKQSLLNLNFDIMQTKYIGLDQKIRKQLFNSALSIIQEEFFIDIMKNLSKVKDSDRYYNWYHGYTRISYPFHDTDSNQLYYRIFTSAIQGNISTKYLCDKFDASKVDTNLLIGIEIHAPESANEKRNNSYTALVVNIDNITMTNDDKMDFALKSINRDSTQFRSNFYEHDKGYYFKLERKSSMEEITRQYLEQMPGFKINWYYDNKVERWAKYKETLANKKYKWKEFAR